MLGDRVKYLREQLDMSQVELANRMGYKSRSSINKIENGRPVTQKVITRLAQALHTTPAYLMGWEEEEKNSSSVDELSPKKQALMQFVQAVPEDKAEMILQVMKTILQVD